MRATARRAADLGVRTELLRVRTRHAVQALLELVDRARRRAAGVRAPTPADRPPALPRRARAGSAATADCLLWVAPDG